MLIPSEEIEMLTYGIGGAPHSVSIVFTKAFSSGQAPMAMD